MDISREQLTSYMQDPNFIQYLTVNNKGRAHLVKIMKNKFSEESQEKDEEDDVQEVEETDKSEMSDLDVRIY